MLPHVSGGAAEPADERWSRMRHLFAAAIELPIESREAWLERECVSDEAMRADLQRLLAAHVAPTDVLDRGCDLVTGLACEPEPERPDERIGKRIGAYRLLRLLGRGGMGSVYLAERADGQFRQNVALKLIHDELPVRGLHERFLRERDILARLSHPNIAQLHEGGVSREGLPYFTLELVEGEPITRWCDKRELGVRERVEVMLRVCDAVQYAHRNLVVHRDLKPSNILVNDAGEPKLLDFGIAKFLDEEPGAAAMTDANAGPMTREYAAPEQVLAQPITTLTDVYSLGVLLYELLSGRLPYPSAERGWISWPKAIVEEPAEPLSRAIARPPLQPSERVAGVAPLPLPGRSMLKRILRGDLDTIVRRALEKAPDARYASVADFSEALRAWRDGRALPGGGMRYRARKFLRRHMLAVAVVSTLVLVALTGVAGIVWEARRTALAGERAQVIQQFLTSVFDVSDPDRSKGQTISARELLDEGARRAQGELGGQPQLQADLLHLIGSLYFRLGLYSRAEALQTQAIALLRATDPRGANLAASLTDAAETARMQERYAEAESGLNEALAIEVANGAEDDGARARTLGSYGDLLGDTARNDDAERVLREALAIDQRLHRAPDERIAADQERLARILDARASYEEAQALLSDSLHQRRLLHGENHSSVAATLVERGKLGWTRGDLADAERDFQDALAITRSLFGARHPKVAAALYWSAGLRSYQGRYAEAEAIIAEALAIDREAFGADSAHDAPFHDLLAEVAQANNDLDRAEREARLSLDLWRRVLGDRHSEVANGLQRLALIERDRGNGADAVGLLQQAVEIRRSTLGPSSERVGFTLANLAETLRIGGRPAEAIERFKEALAIYHASLPGNHVRVVEASSGMGHAQLDAGDTSGAIATLERAVQMARIVYPEGHPDRMRALLPLGQAYLVGGDAARAVETLDEAKNVMTRNGAAHVRNAVQTLTLLARAHAALHREAEAAIELADARTLLAAHPQGVQALLRAVDDAQHEIESTKAHSQHASR